jgi:hypothetical protein
MAKKSNKVSSRKKVGRPSSYSSKLAMEICEAVATSSVGIKMLCRAHTHWPNPDTIYQWLRTYDEFSDQYARAKRLQVDVLVDEVLEIADGVANSNLAAINGAKLKIDTRKWIASKLVPRLYGDKIHSEITGLNNQPIEVNVNDAKSRLFEKLVKIASEQTDSESDS